MKLAQKKTDYWKLFSTYLVLFAFDWLTLQGNTPVCLMSVCIIIRSSTMVYIKCNSELMLNYA